MCLLPGTRGHELAVHVHTDDGVAGIELGGDVLARRAVPLS